MKTKKKKNRGKDDKVFAVYSADFVSKLFGGAEPNSNSDPHILIKLYPDPKKNTYIRVRFGSVATSATNIANFVSA